MSGKDTPYTLTEKGSVAESSMLATHVDVDLIQDGGRKYELLKKMR